MFAKIIVATDFGEASERAVKMAAKLAETFHAALVVTHTYETPVYAYPSAPVIPIMNITESVAKAAQMSLDAALPALRTQVPGTIGVLRNGLPWRETLEVVKEQKGDLLIVGTHGRHGLSHALLGSVAEKIVRMSHIPVLTVPAKAAKG
jgi:nucleotide-binding universal stress UspA family protein